MERTYLSKWSSGGDGHFSTGIGPTRMLNSEGYMCCLGQFAQQVGVKEQNLLGKTTPDHVAKHLDKIYDDNYFYKGFL